jgi:hypothetical protein
VSPPHLVPNVLLGFISILVAAKSVSAVPQVVTPVNSRPTISAPAVGKESLPKVDGQINEAIWTHAEPATQFTQVRPHPGGHPSARTEVRVLIAGGALYVAMQMYDNAPDSIAAQLGRRDASGLNSDWARVLIDGGHDGRTALEFAINPRGVKADSYWYADTQEDRTWDGVWDAAAHIDSTGWTAEFRIPVSQLRSAQRGHDGAVVWGAQFIRDIARYSERDSWSPIPGDATGFVSRFGIMIGNVAGTLRSPVEVTPYSVTSITRAPGDLRDPFYARSKLKSAVGADMRFAPRSDVLINTTVNPDFGQVEADPAVVNLSAYQVFFPEQRPFFVEGSDLFQEQVAGAQIFYSRRIGRAPQLDVPSSALYASVPSATRILGAAKVSRRLGDGWSFGFLDAVTGREYAGYADSTAKLHSVLVEPLTNFAVARANRLFLGGHSAIGVLGSAVQRALTSPVAAALLASRAYTGGLDARHQFGNNEYEAVVSVVGSLVTGSVEAMADLQRSSVHLFQRPDALGVHYDSTRTSVRGLAVDSRLDKIAGHWRGGGQLSLLTPGFDVNNAGFQDASDVGQGIAYLSYDDQNPGRHLRNWHGFINQVWTRDGGGERLSHSGQLGVRFELPNNWSGAATFSHEGSGLSPAATRGGPAVTTPPNSDFTLDLNGDSRQSVSWAAHTGMSIEPQTRGFAVVGNSTLLARVNDRWSFSVQPSASRVVNPWQYVTTAIATSLSASNSSPSGGPRYVFGKLAQTSWSVTARGAIIVTPQVSVEFYTRPFFSIGHYTGFRSLARARANTFAERFRLIEPTAIRTAPGNTFAVNDSTTADSFSFTNPDFDVAAFQSNAVLRWEYRPGSTLFLVWSQRRNRSGSDGLAPMGQSLQRLWGAPPTNIFLVKGTYWWGL